MNQYSLLDKCTHVEPAAIGDELKSSSIPITLDINPTIIYPKSIQPIKMDKHKERYLNSLGIWTKDKEILFRERIPRAVGHRRSFSNLKEIENLLKPESDEQLHGGLAMSSEGSIKVPRDFTEIPNHSNHSLTSSTDESNSLVSSLETLETLEGRNLTDIIINSEKSPHIDSMRNMRIKYLSKVGIEVDRKPPLRTPKSSPFNLTIRQEKLKDPREYDMFDDLVKVIGGLVGVASPRDKEPLLPPPCSMCISTDGNKTSPCLHKRVRFDETVKAVYIPPHYDYSSRVRQSYWASATEIREMVQKNMIEFDAEGYEWTNVAEEEDMYYDAKTKEYIHPVFFDEIETNAYEGEGTRSNLDFEGRNDGLAVSSKKSLPRMGKNTGPWNFECED